MATDRLRLVSGHVVPVLLVFLYDHHEVGK